MLRTRFSLLAPARPTNLLFAAAASTSASTSSSSSSSSSSSTSTTDSGEYHPTEIQSAYQLLRLLLRSAEVKLQSRQGRNFMKRRIVSQWRVGREEKDPVKQRALMERAACVLHAMHIKGRAPKPDEPIELDFTNLQHTRSRLD